MSNKCTDCSNLTVAMQKYGGKYVASVTNYDIPTIHRKTGHKRKEQSKTEILTVKGAVNHFFLRMRILI